MNLTISAPIPVSTVANAPSSSPEPDVSSAGSTFDHVANRPRAAELASRVLERVRSGFAYVFEGIRNLGCLLTDCLPHKRTADPVAVQPPVDLRAENLAAGADALIRVIPKMSSALQSGSRNDEMFAADFRALRFGLRLLHTAADGLVEKGAIPKRMADEIGALRGSITADNQTQEQLEIRLLKGDTDFLDDPGAQTDLHNFFRRARDLAVVVVAQSGELGLAQQLDALYRKESAVN